MFTVNDRFTSTLVEKQSKFIANLIPYHLLAKTLETLKSEHPKARHFVTAYRYLNEFEQVVEGCSDDGEPKGTSGKPSLAVLQGHELINVAVVTVRYFGGTKLGTGGLVRAYSGVTNAVIDSAEPVEYQKELQEKISISYSDIGKVEYAVEQSGLRVVDKWFNAKEAVFIVGGTRQSLDAFFDKVKRLVKRL